VTQSQPHESTGPWAQDAESYFHVPLVTALRLSQKQAQKPSVPPEVSIKRNILFSMTAIIVLIISRIVSILAVVRLFRVKNRYKKTHDIRLPLYLTYECEVNATHALLVRGHWTLFIRKLSKKLWLFAHILGDISFTSRSREHSKVKTAYSLS